MKAYKKEEIQELAQGVLDLGSACEEVEVRFATGLEELTRFSGNDIQQNVSNADTSISVRLLEKGRQGMASTNRLDKEGLSAMIRTARQVASFQEPLKDALPLVSTCTTPEGSHLDEATATLSPEARAEACKEAFEMGRKHEMDVSGIYSTGFGQMALANSAGLYCQYQRSSATWSNTFTSSDSSGWAEGQGAKVSDLNPSALAKEALQIALDSRNPGSVSPGDYTVVMPPAAVADLVMILNWLCFGGQDLVEGTGPLSSKVGEQLFNPSFHVQDDGAGLLVPSCPWDWEGNSRQIVDLVTEGRYLGAVHDRRSAKKLGIESTGHSLQQPNGYGAFPDNLVIAPGDSSIEKMIASTEKGLLVTHLHYTNVQDPNELLLTGMTRDGLFLIENGKVVRPVKNMRFTESLLRAFSNIESLTKERSYQSGFFGGGFLLPGMKIKDFRFSSETGF
jgi:PmbA protein